MNVRRLGTAAALAAALAVAGCGGSGGSSTSVTACRHAMQKQLASAAGGNQAHQSEPAACKGIPAKTVEKIAEDLIGKALTGG